jgi:hypothetical protein
MFTPADYDVGTAAALKLIRHEVEVDVLPKVPVFMRGAVPVDKEPEAAAAITKCVLDAVAASHAMAPLPGRTPGVASTANPAPKAT